MKIESLFIYPIKSCAGIQCCQFNLLRNGPENDRMLVLVDQNGHFLSQRKLPKMALIRTSIVKCPFTGSGERAVQAEAPGMDKHFIPLIHGTAIFLAEQHRECSITIHKDAPCKGIDLGDTHAEWFSEFLGTPCRLVRQTPSLPRLRDASSLGRKIEVTFADGYPLLITSTDSLIGLNERITIKNGTPVTMDRFRPNIVISGSGPHAEDGWKEVTIGNALIEGAKRCVRCPITTIDQETAERGFEPLRTLATYRKSGIDVMFGKNFAVLKPGSISVGDEVFPENYVA